jgi:hypothetical protein
MNPARAKPATQGKSSRRAKIFEDFNTDEHGSHSDYLCSSIVPVLFSASVSALQRRNNLFFWQASSHGRLDKTHEYMRFQFIASAASSRGGLNEILSAVEIPRRSRNAL